MARYNKLFAALIGVGALVAVRYFEVSVPGLEPIVMDLVVGALTAFGVYQFPNSDA